MRVTESQPWTQRVWPTEALRKLTWSLRVRVPYEELPHSPLDQFLLRKPRPTWLRSSTSGLRKCGIQRLRQTNRNLGARLTILSARAAGRAGLHRNLTYHDIPPLVSSSRSYRTSLYPGTAQ